MKTRWAIASENNFWFFECNLLITIQRSDALPYWIEKKQNSLCFSIEN